jgi:hypothetical protein
MPAAEQPGRLNGQGRIKLESRLLGGFSLSAEARRAVDVCVAGFFTNVCNKTNSPQTICLVVHLTRYASKRLLFRPIVGELKRSIEIVLSACDWCDQMIGQSLGRLGSIV